MSEYRWTQYEAIDLCRKIEELAPPFGCHIALTGGALYKGGLRKDVDIVVYRIRQKDEIDIMGLMKALATIGIEPGIDHGFCYKARLGFKDIDFLFPDRIYDKATIMVTTHRASFAYF